MTADMNAYIFPHPESQISWERQTMRSCYAAENIKSDKNGGNVRDAASCIQSAVIVSLENTSTCMGSTPHKSSIIIMSLGLAPPSHRPMGSLFHRADNKRYLGASPTPPGLARLVLEHYWNIMSKCDARTCVSLACLHTKKARTDATED